MAKRAPQTRRSKPIVTLLALTCSVVFTAFLVSSTKATAAMQNDAASFNTKGLALYAAGKFDEAAEAFKQAIKLKKDYPEAYNNLGDCYFQLEFFKEAIEAYKHVVRYEPNFAPARNNMGTAYYKLGEYKKAAEAFKEAIRLDPKTARTYFNLANAYVQLNDQKSALQQYEILKTLDAQIAEEVRIAIYKPMALVSGDAGVRLNVIATNAQGSPVIDLAQDDFQVFEDGAPQTISSFSKGQAPIIYGLAVDGSLSMRASFPLVLEACKRIIQTNQTDDETLITLFISSDKISTEQEFSTDKTKLNKAIDGLYPEGGQSALLDAVYLSAERVAQYKFANSSLHRALILITDGDDRLSYYKMEEVLKLLRKVDVPVFAISLSLEDKKGAQLNQNQSQRSIDLLTTLAKETGGYAFFPKTSAELQIILAQLTNLIRFEYVVGYKSSNAHGPGKYHLINVKILPKPGQENWRASTRRGYVVSEK